MEATKPNQPTPQPKKVEIKPNAGSKVVTSNVKGIKNAFVVIVICFIIAVCLYLFFFGNPSNFKDGNTDNHPINLIGTVYKGGVIVPILQTLFLTVIVLSVERWLALSKADGKGSTTKFVAKVKDALAKGQGVAEAENLCRQQAGTVGAIVYSALQKYKEMEASNLPKEQKLSLIQQQIDEATALEMPSLQQNLPILATLTTLGTLIGLLGTVLGMIKAFQALSASGAPDSTALSTGISEALVNTALGILTASLALISYNFYTNKIDNLTYAVDELGFAIVSAYAQSHNA